MRFPKNLIFLVLVLVVGIIGCDSKIAPHDLEGLKASTEKITGYSCDFTRTMDGETVHGRLYYREGSIRFESPASSGGDTVVTIVNQENDTACTYSEKLKKGEISQGAAFYQDVPLVSEIMKAISAENARFLNAEMINDEEYAIYAVEKMPMYGGSLTGQVYIRTADGLPLSAEGARSGRQVNFQYTNYNLETLDQSLFQVPDGISLTKR